ncbi:ACT domain-containing protein [Desulfacinum infernum]|uniref:ACT domain-containing protein n=1 Tax=Desulfacinum infernum TaxID=35837 RepID=UPI000932465E|nr:ACT domain-containing protein [Desulfacinum infernum]
MQNKWPNKALHLTAIRLRPLGGMTTRVNGSTGFERMEGETNLSVLLAAMRPILHDEAYVFCVVDQDTYEKLPFTPLCTFREREGITVIVTQQQAEVYGLPFPESVNRKAAD